MTALVTCRLGQMHSTPDSPSLHGRILYLPEWDIIVAPETNLGLTWRCSVIARGVPLGATHLYIDALELAVYGQTELHIFPLTQPDLYAMAWQAQVFAHWPWTGLARFARALGEEIRPAHSIVLDLSLNAIRRLASATNLRPAALQLNFDRLRQAGYLNGTLGAGAALTLP
jgi:hypothetical protein